MKETETARQQYRATSITIATICIALLSVPGAYGQNTIDVDHYRFAISLSDQYDTISGKATIRFRAVTPCDSVLLDFTENTGAKGMKVLRVSSDENGDSLLAFTHTRQQLAIALPRTVTAGTMASVTIRYSGIPTDGLIISKNKYGHRTFFADNWPNRGHNWIPCADQPADKATVDFVVTAPQHYQVVANGVQVEETNLADDRKRTHWQESVPISTKVMVIGAADFAVQRSGVVNGCIPVYSWVYPEDRDKGFYDYAQAVGILNWYISNVGPYGFHKLANVQSKTIFGGLENANTIFYSENSITGTRRSESLLAHEIAHQWFGNMATEATFAHLWLSEGFATYMTIEYMESRYGTDTLTAMLREDREQVIRYSKKSQRPVVDPSETNYMNLLNANSYQKGGWVLHMLRRELGESIFQAAIRKYYETYAGRTASTDDLMRVFENVSGKDLHPFFKQWLYSPGQPKLEASWKYDTKTQQISVSIKQLQSPTQFRFPLDIGIRYADGTEDIKQVSVSQMVEILQLPAAKRPVELTLDPKVSLLFEGSIRQVK